ncbi:hypothetical protein LguiB_012575 [Lonicera macranthoides]
MRFESFCQFSFFAILFPLRASAHYEIPQSAAAPIHRQKRLSTFIDCSSQGLQNSHILSFQRCFHPNLPISNLLSANSI